MQEFNDQPNLFYRACSLTLIVGPILCSVEASEPLAGEGTQTPGALTDGTIMPPHNTTAMAAATSTDNTTAPTLCSVAAPSTASAEACASGSATPSGGVPAADSNHVLVLHTLNVKVRRS